MHIEDNWDELDIIAKSNLRSHDYYFFLSHKSDLKESGCEWACASAALRDYISKMNELYLYDN